MYILYSIFQNSSNFYLCEICARYHTSLYPAMLPHTIYLYALCRLRSLGWVVGSFRIIRRPELARTFPFFSLYIRRFQLVYPPAYLAYLPAFLLSLYTLRLSPIYTPVPTGLSSQLTLSSLRPLSTRSSLRSAYTRYPSRASRSIPSCPPTPQRGAIKKENGKERIRQKAKLLYILYIIFLLTYLM